MKIFILLSKGYFVMHHDSYVHYLESGCQHNSGASVLNDVIKLLRDDNGFL